MERTRTLLAFLVLTGFAITAAMPFLGIRPADLLTRGAETVAVSAPPVLLAGLDVHADDPELAKAAVYALANSLDAESISMMFPLINEPLPLEVRKAVLYAVANHDGANVVAFLRGVAAGDAEAELRKAAVYAIGNSDHPDAVPALVAVMGSDAPNDVRKAAVHALGNQDSDVARKALVDLIGNLQ